MPLAYADDDDVDIIDRKVAVAFSKFAEEARTIVIPQSSDISELSHIGSNQRLFDWPKRRIDGKSTV